MFIKMTKVLLTYINSYMDNLIPIGVSVLSACLKKAGHKTKLFDTTFYKTSEKTGDEARVETLQVLPTDLSKFGIHKKNTNMAEDFKRAIREFNPEIIGFSAVESTYHITLDLLKEIKIDLHILPFQVLYSEKVREKYLKGHSDQNFFTNAFSVLLCYDFSKKEFVSTNIEELVKKHRRKRRVVNSHHR